MQYYEWLLEWLRRKEMSVKPSTYQTYGYEIQKHLIPKLGKKDLEAIATPDVMAAMQDWEAEGLSSKTIADLIVLIKMTLKDYAHDKDMALKPIGIKVQRNDNQKIKIFTNEEQRKIMLGIYKEQKPKAVGIALGLCAGLRIGEICALRWKDIDLRQGLIHINGTVQRTLDKKTNKTKVVRGATKTPYSDRIIPIDSTLKMLLTLIECNDKEAFLLTGKRKCLEPKTFRSFFYRFLRKYKIEKQTFHCLRHSFGTKAIRCGVDARTLQEIMGHASVEITLGLYVHPQIDDKRDALEKINMQWLKS